ADHPEPSQRDQTGLLSEAFLSAAAQNRKLLLSYQGLAAHRHPLRQTRSKFPCRRDPHRRTLLDQAVSPDPNDFQSCAAVLNCSTSSFTSIWSRRDRAIAALEEVAGRGTTLAVAPVNAGCSPPRQRRIAGWQQAVRRLGQRSSPCSLARPPS